MIRLSPTLCDGVVIVRQIRMSEPRRGCPIAKVCSFGGFSADFAREHLSTHFVNVDIHPYAQLDRLEAVPPIVFGN